MEKKKVVRRGVTAHNRWSKSLLSRYCSGKSFKASYRESHAQNVIGNRQSLQKKPLQLMKHSDFGLDFNAKPTTRVTWAPLSTHRR